MRREGPAADKGGERRKLKLNKEKLKDLAVKDRTERALKGGRGSMHTGCNCPTK